MTEEPSTIAMVRSLFQEVADYARDLGRLFAAEAAEKSRSLRMLAAMAGAAILLLLFSFLFLSLALIGAIAYGLASWRWALLIVGAAYGIVGLLLALPLARGLRRGLLRFDRTQRHLKEDAAFVKSKLAA